VSEFPDPRVARHYQGPFTEREKALLDQFVTDVSVASGIPRHLLRGVPVEEIDTMSAALCKGSVVLGTGCKRCERCIQAFNDLADPTNDNTARLIGEAEGSFRSLFAWITAGDVVGMSHETPYRWTRAGFTAEHMTQTPAGEFYLIRKPDTGFVAYLRPDALACLGWMQRIDLRGETTLHSLAVAARVDSMEEDPMFAEVPERPASVVVRLDDPLLIAVKAEFLHGMPDLTGRQINELAMMAVAAVKRVANRE
jgi:hypothetical protein